MLGEPKMQTGVLTSGRKTQWNRPVRLKRPPKPARGLAGFTGNNVAGPLECLDCELVRRAGITFSANDAKRGRWTLDCPRGVAT
jgi:hypothetical protein